MIVAFRVGFEELPASKEVHIPDFAETLCVQAVNKSAVLFSCLIPNSCFQASCFAHLDRRNRRIRFLAGGT